MLVHSLRGTKPSQPFGCLPLYCGLLRRGCGMKNGELGFAARTLQREIFCSSETARL
jgi:hypothetical protein